MTNEERDLIAKFIARVSGAQQAQGGFLPGQGGGSVPQSQPPLPPIDREADQFIAEQFQRYPEARYRITQLAIVEEAALAEMNNRVQRLEWELNQARQQLQQAQSQPQQSKGFFGSLFGGGSSQPRPRQSGPWGGGGGQPGSGGSQPGYGGPHYAPPPPQYPPQYQPGMFGRGGSGFLGSALTTAAGVAGGMVVGNALMNAFSGHHGGVAQAAMPGGFLGADATSGPFDAGGVVPTADPTSGWGSGGGDPFAQGGDAKGFDDGGLSQDAGFGGGGFDQGGFDQGGFDQGGFDQGGGFDSGGFDSGGFDNT